MREPWGPSRRTVSPSCMPMSGSASFQTAEVFLSSSVKSSAVWAGRLSGSARRRGTRSSRAKYSSKYAASASGQRSPR